MSGNPTTATPIQGHNTRSEVGKVELAAGELTKAGAVSINGNNLTIQNQKLADLIHSKLADAAKLTPAARAATDVDVGVSVKVKK
jgi:hypothetical protein